MGIRTTNTTAYLIVLIIIGIIGAGRGMAQAQDAGGPIIDMISPADPLPFKDEIPLDGNQEAQNAYEPDNNQQSEPLVQVRETEEETAETQQVQQEETQEAAVGPAESGTPEDPESPQETQAAQPQPKKKTGADMDQIITLDLRGMDVSDALTYISLRSGANIVSSKLVTGRVTLQLKDVPLQDVFDITLLTNNLAYEKIGDIIYVMTEQEYEARYGKKFSDIREVKIIQLKFAIPEKAFDLLDTLKSSIGRILVDQESGAVLIVDTKTKIMEMEEALATLEKKNEVNVFNLQYAVAQDVEEQLRAQLDDINVGSIWSDERNNQVVVQALSDRMDHIKEIISALDQKTREVLIDTKIVKVQVSDSVASGFEWEGMFQELFDSAGGGFIGSHVLQPVERLNQTFIDDFTTIQPEDENPSAGSKRALGEQIVFGSVNSNHSFEVLMRFLGTLGETRLLSNPKIAVINNQEARIHVGRQEAYITSTTTAGQTTTTTAEDVTFVNVGIQLSVTPTINEEGFITMKIKPEVSSVVDTLVTPSGNQIPIIDTSLAETTVIVKDNATILIGGLRREEETLAAKRIPFLGDLPLLGSIFRSQTKGTERSELIVMITPHIVDGMLVTTGDVDEPGERATKTYKDYQTFDSIADTYGPEFGVLDYKPFRD